MEATDTDGNGIDAATEAAFVAALEKVEADQAREKEKKLWAAESTRLAAICGKSEKESAWLQIKTKERKAPCILKAAQPHRNEAEKARHKAQMTKVKLQLRMTTFLKMRKRKVAAQKVKESRARRMVHHWKYLEDTLKKEKAAKSVPFEERAKKKIAIQEAKDAHIAEMARLVKERDARVEREKMLIQREQKRIVAQEAKDARKARAENLRKALASIERRRKKEASS